MRLLLLHFLSIFFFSPENIVRDVGDIMFHLLFSFITDNANCQQFHAMLQLVCNNVDPDLYWKLVSKMILFREAKEIVTFFFLY